MDIQDICAKWQKQLGLSDWTIQCDLVGVKDMDSAYNAGHTDFDTSRRLARIKIARREELKCDFSSVEAIPTIESTIVHELIHLVLAHCEVTSSNDEE